MSQHLPIFVYGTLKRGQEREPLWPCPPTAVESATTQGRLHDLGPYPAMVEGEDRVAGELWHLAEEDMPRTLKTLDEIECCDQGGVDLYVRKIVPCRNERGHEQDAYVYLYGEVDAIVDKRIVPPGDDGLCRWPDHL